MPSPSEPTRWRRSELRNATAVNQGTGEVIELGDISGMAPAQSRRKKSRKEIKFVMVAISMDAMPRLNMAKGEWTLFWTLVSYLDLERGEARVSTKELAEKVDRFPQDVSRSLTRLRKRNILIRERQGVWRVNPHLLARGTVEQWEVDMRTAPTIDWDGE